MSAVCTSLGCCSIPPPPSLLSHLNAARRRGLGPPTCETDNRVYIYLKSAGGWLLAAAAPPLLLTSNYWPEHRTGPMQILLDGGAKNSLVGGSNAINGKMVEPSSWSLLFPHMVALWTRIWLLEVEE